MMVKSTMTIMRARCITKMKMKRCFFLELVWTYQMQKNIL